MSSTCEICKKDFKNQAGLSIHTSKMHSSPTCGICQKSDFKNEHGLSIHMSKMHPQDSNFCGRKGNEVKETELYSRHSSQHGIGGKDRKDKNPSSRQRPSTAGHRRDELKNDTYQRPKTSFSKQRETPRTKDGYQGRSPTTHNLHGSTERDKCKSYSGPEREHKSDILRGTKSMPSKWGEIPKTDFCMVGNKDAIRGVAKVVQTSPQTSITPQEKTGYRNDKLSKPKEPSRNDRPSSSMSNASLSCLASDKDKLLTILKAGIKCPKEDSKLRVDRVNTFVKHLEETIARISDFPVELFKSGSYYDKTKIDYADEFDFMFYPRVNFEADFHNCPPGYCKIKKGRTTNQDFDKMFNRDGYLVPESFKIKMFQIFAKCIASPDFREGRRTKRKERLLVSPAFTVLYDLQLTDKPPIDIDLVPAIKVDGWPSKFKQLQANWLSEEHAKEAMKCFHVVTKTFPGTHPDAELLWRVSFSHAERKLIHHADYTDKGIRKTIFKILKKLKEDIKTECQGQIDKFCSYHLKMFMLGFYDRHTDFSEKNEKLLFCQSIRELVKCLQGGGINNYFIPSDNILKYVPDNEKALVARKLDEYIQ